MSLCLFSSRGSLLHLPVSASHLSSSASSFVCLTLSPILSVSWSLSQRLPPQFHSDFVPLSLWPLCLTLSDGKDRKLHICPCLIGSSTPSPAARMFNDSWAHSPHEALFWFWPLSHCLLRNPHDTSRLTAKTPGPLSPPLPAV